MEWNRKWMRAACVCLFVTLLLAGAWLGMYQVPDSGWELKITYGEFHENRDGGTSQLFYADEKQGFSEERSLMQSVWEMDQSVTFELPDFSLAHTKLRFDPFMNQDMFSIYSVGVRYQGELKLTILGNEFRGLVGEIEHCEYDDRTGLYIPLTEDPVLYLDTNLGQRIVTVWRNEYLTYQRQSGLILAGILFLFLALGMFCVAGKREREADGTKRKWWPVILADVVICLGAALVCAVYFTMRNFGNVRLEELFFLMNTALNGSNLSSFYTLFLTIAVIVVAVSALVFGGAWLLKKENRAHGYAVWAAALGLSLIGGAAWIAAGYFDVASYLAYIHDKSSFYEEYYVDAWETELVFPEKKRNLIYIYLESMEMTYADKAAGGAMEENYIPELTKLAVDHIDFSGSDTLNGAHTVSGTTFTSGAMVAQTAGVPINTSIISNGTVNAGAGAENLLPGAWTLGDVLEQEGYQQVLMIGSDAGFGTRRQYFEGHGNYQIYDYYAARDAGWIPEDYYVWWGYEDELLLEFAKDEIRELADGEGPFNFTMLTVDTHFSGGYWCDLCKNEYPMQYSNVIACSSRQIGEFVDWIMQQDFYKDTTVVISGDHLTMDTDYTGQVLYGNNFDRRTFVSIINPAEGCEEPDVMRDYSTLDLYPTTLAALGVEIDGDRLGLGVNLFAGIPTLYEEYGGAYLDAELLKRSDLYADQLVYGEEHLAVDDPEDGES